MRGQDVIVVGGGFAGAALAYALATAGVDVLVLERDREFRDRVRGETIYPWGVAEARRLGLYETLRGAGMELHEWTTTIDPFETWPRQLEASSPAGEPALTFAHVDAQSALLSAAEAAGAEVMRGAVVTGVSPGDTPRVAYHGASGRAETERQARLIVGADGRSSVTARTAGFGVNREPEALTIAGVMLAGAAAPHDVGAAYMHPTTGLMGMSLPIGNGRHRIYAGYHVAAGRRNLSGPTAWSQFIDTAVGGGMPADWFEGAEMVGPLAEFSGADSWVTAPARDGVVLVGDAAAVSDPNWGCGLSLAMRDVRMLTEALLGSEDWEAAARTYAAEHDVQHGRLRRQTGWLTELMRTPGPEADAKRRRAFPGIRADPRIVPDVVGIGPDALHDEAARLRLYGEV